MGLSSVWGFGVSPLDLVLRGSLVFWLLFLLFRFVLRRDPGNMGIADVLLLVLIADASQNAMSGGYTTVSEGAVLVGTIAGWSWLLDWASWRSPLVRRFAEPKPLVLVRRGRLLRRNLHREYITVPELLALLRERGIDKLADVKMARLEPDGQLSVIRRDTKADTDGAA